MYKIISHIFIVISLVFIFGCEFKSDFDNNNGVNSNPGSTSSQQGLGGTLLSALGIGVSEVSDNQHKIPDAELRGLSELGVRIYAKKFVLANDLISNQGSHAESCGGTVFGEFLAFENNIELADLSSRDNRSQDKLDWASRIASIEAQGIADDLDFPPPLANDVPDIQREVGYQIFIEENHAYFWVTFLDRNHFRLIELNSVEARTAKLTTRARGRVITTANDPQLLRAHPILLTYYFTKGSDDTWRCAHLHASYNPFDTNKAFYSDLADCEFERGGFLGIGARRDRERCKQNVRARYREDFPLPG